MAVYIQSANQLSAQAPLSDEWFDQPRYYTEARVPTIDPTFSDYLSPLLSRRMCTLLKRAVILSRLTLKASAIAMPDAIISGTGLGCIDNTEKFLISIMENEEKFLQPTYFMQSTHNIISSTIAIDLKCHGYNNSFVHRGVSFENALLDALMQFNQQRIRTALVGGYDELTDNYYTLFGKMGMWDFQQEDSPRKRCFAGEASVSMLLGREKDEQTLCVVDDVQLMHRPTPAMLKETLDGMLAKAGYTLSDIDAVLTGMNTHPENDAIYTSAGEQLLGNRPLMQYKHLFGESFSASAMAAYVAATCLKKGRIPASLLSGSDADITDAKRILVYNHYQNRSHSLILLSSCSS